MNRVRSRKAQHAAATHFEQVPLAEILKGIAGRKPQLVAAPQTARSQAGLDSQRAQALRAEAMRNAERNRKLAAVLQETLALVGKNRAQLPAGNSVEFDTKWRRLMQEAAEAAKSPSGAPTSSTARTARSSERTDKIAADAHLALGEDDDASPV